MCVLCVGEYFVCTSFWCAGKKLCLDFAVSAVSGISGIGLVEDKPARYGLYYIDCLSEMQKFKNIYLRFRLLS